MNAVTAPSGIARLWRFKSWSTPIVSPRGVRIGWLGDLGGYLAMEAGILDLCERGLHRAGRT